MTTVDKTLLLTDGEAKTAELPNLVGEYEQLLAAASPQYDFPDFDENSVATTFYTTGTTGNPKGVYFTHRQLVLHTLAEASVTGSIDSVRLLGSTTSTCRSRRCFMYMPGAFPTLRPCWA